MMVFRIQTKTLLTIACTRSPKKLALGDARVICLKMGVKDGYI